jgi:transcriptional regulator with XRE-family HTH domain
MLMARADSVVLPSLAYWRGQRDFTQERLAERVGLCRNTVWRIEAGYPAFLRTVRLLAGALGVDPADLMCKQPES